MNEVVNKSTKIFVFFGLILYSHISMYTRSACIIIHGTWAKDCAWYLPGGSFYEAVKLSLQELQLADEIVSFRWSGLLGSMAHQQAAQNLAKLIMEYEKVVLVAHSHGATVGIIATMVLGSNNSSGKLLKRVSRFYALGVPVDPTRIIYPDMSIVDKFYNLFSFGDLIQRVHGLYDRCFAPHVRLTNIAAMLGDLHPSHSDLHHPVIGLHLLKIPDFFQQQMIGNFSKYQDGLPSQITFSQNKHPVFAHQPNQYSLIELDKVAFDLAQRAFFRNPACGSDS